ERCLAAGMNDYVAKPVAFEALAAVLERWVPRGGRPAEARSTPAAAAATSPLDERVVDQLRALDAPGSGFFEGVVGLFLDTTPPPARARPSPGGGPARGGGGGPAACTAWAWGSRGGRRRGRAGGTRACARWPRSSAASARRWRRSRGRGEPSRHHPRAGAPGR